MQASPWGIGLHTQRVNAQRGLGEPVGLPRVTGQSRHLPVVLPCGGQIAGTTQRVPATQQQHDLAPAQEPGRRQPVQGSLTMPRRILVGQPLNRLCGAAKQYRTALSASPGVAGARPPRAGNAVPARPDTVRALDTRFLQRLRQAQVQLGPHPWRKPVIQRLPEQVVAEPERPGRAGRLRQYPRPHGHLDVVRHDAGRAAGDPGEQTGADVATGHGGNRQQRHTGLRQPGQPLRHHLPHPLGNAAHRVASPSPPRLTSNRVTSRTKNGLPAVRRNTPAVRSPSGGRRPRSRSAGRRPPRPARSAQRRPVAPARQEFRRVCRRPRRRGTCRQRA